MSELSNMLEKIESLAAGVCEREGCRLYDVEWVSGSKGMGRVLRVYVDRADQKVSLEDCENVSRGLNLMLDVEDVSPGGEYSLEVSTPGLERVLRRPDHFQGAVGQTVQLKTSEDLNELNPEHGAGVKRMRAKGVIVKTSESSFTLLVDNKEFEVPYSIVEKAQVVWDFESEKGKKK